MQNNDLTRKKSSLGINESSWDDARIVVLGVPLDSASSYRPGARFAPEGIRNVFESLEEYSLDLAVDIEQVPFYDLGDLLMEGSETYSNLIRGQKIIADMVKQGKKPLVIGGDHAVTYAPVKVLFENVYQEDLVLLHFDAHLDLRPGYMGDDYSHASVIYRLLELGVREIYQFGIRSAATEEVETARRQTRFYPHQILEPLREIMPQLQGRPVYVTLDIDVVDPGLAPGVGTPEPGGITSNHLLQLFPVLKQLNIVGFDVVEVNPPYDNSQVTTHLAAKLVREALMIM